MIPRAGRASPVIDRRCPERDRTMDLLVPLTKTQGPARMLAPIKNLLN